MIKINVDARSIAGEGFASVGVDGELCACLAGLYVDIFMHNLIILENGNPLDNPTLIDFKKEALGSPNFYNNFLLLRLNRAAHEIAK